MILEGKTLRDTIATTLKEKIQAAGITPVLAILQVGDRDESNAYINQKKLFAEKIGVEVKHKRYPVNISQNSVLETIAALNADNTVQGIILQLPVPDHLDKDVLIESIKPEKDVDGLTAINTKRLWSNDPRAIVPATVRGVLTMLEHYKIDVDGKKVAVVGRSMLVGKPMAAALLNKNATVTICHRHTTNLAAETKNADVIIVATGVAGLIKADHVKKGQCIIDVGISLTDGDKQEDGTMKKKMVGDVDFDAVKDIAEGVSPVPGGVGPLTVASLFENLVDTLN